MSLAAITRLISILITLLAMYRAQQRSFALSVAQNIKSFVGSQTIAKRIQNSGLTHAIDPDQICDLLDVQKIVCKIVPIDQPQAVQCDHVSSSSPAFRYLFSSSIVASLDAFSTLSGKARITVG